MSLVPPKAGCPALLDAAGALQTRCAQTVQIPFSAASPVLGGVPMGFFLFPPICPAAPRRRGRKRRGNCLRAKPEFFRVPPSARSKGSPQGQDWLGCRFLVSSFGHAKEERKQQQKDASRNFGEAGITSIGSFYLCAVGVLGFLGGEGLTMDAGTGKDHHGRILEGFETQGPTAVRMLWFVGDVEVEAGQAVWPLCGWGGHWFCLRQWPGAGVAAPPLQGRAAERSGPAALPGRESCPRTEGCRRVRRRGRAWQVNRQSGRR